MIFNQRIEDKVLTDCYSVRGRQRIEFGYQSIWINRKRVVCVSNRVFLISNWTVMPKKYSNWASSLDLIQEYIHYRLFIDHIDAEECFFGFLLLLDSIINYNAGPSLSLGGYFCCCGDRYRVMVSFAFPENSSQNTPYGDRSIAWPIEGHSIFRLLQRFFLWGSEFNDDWPSAMPGNRRGFPGQSSSVFTRAGLHMRANRAPGQQFLMASTCLRHRRTIIIISDAAAVAASRPDTATGR